MSENTHSVAAAIPLEERPVLEKSPDSTPQRAPDADGAGLLPCPFCGGKGHHIVHQNRWHLIMCETCGARCQPADGDWWAPPERWNRRVASPSLIEACRRLVTGAKLTDAGWLLDSNVVQEIDEMTDPEFKP